MLEDTCAFEYDQLAKTHTISNLNRMGLLPYDYNDLPKTIKEWHLDQLDEDAGAFAGEQQRDMFSMGGGKQPIDVTLEFKESAEFEKSGWVATDASSSSGSARPFGVNDERPSPLPRPPGMPAMHPHLDHAPLTLAPLVNDQPTLNPSTPLVDLVRHASLDTAITIATMGIANFESCGNGSNYDVSQLIGKNLSSVR